MKNINNKKFILMFSFISIFFINNHAISESFFDEAKQKFDQKNMMTLNFCFKGTLFTTQRMQNHIYI